ncbi:ankyrin repeat domain-containing protein 26-like isoform X2 [Sarcophilus harrisii]|uniref:ankyrin repeat domain-containing protein 26-like isoform X2 n=1 Tax=Sarcophilus harrisii TaxID=9305 RepID=UPI001301EDF7|nr:ankyrin repeat domain-containing protein 26-like isoform X2 [Sarcophilus harrisii]
MRKTLSFSGKKGQSPSRSSATPRRDCWFPESDTNAEYLIQDKDFGKLHKAASVGDVAQVQQMLLVGKQDVKDTDEVKHFSDKPGADDSSPIIDEEELDFTEKKPSDLNLTKIINVSQQIKKMDEKNSMVSTEQIPFFGHHQSTVEKKDMTDSPPKPSSQAQCSPHSVHPSSSSFSKPSCMISTLAIDKEESIHSKEEEKEDNVLVDEETRKQTSHKTPNIPKEHSTSAKSGLRKDRMSTSVLEEEEDTESSPWDSESISESLPKEPTMHMLASTNQTIKDSISMGQLEDQSKGNSIWKPIQHTLEIKDSFTNQEIEKEVKEKQKSDSTQELEFKGLSEGGRECFDKSDQKQVKEEMKKHQHNEVETLKEKDGDKFTESRTTGKVNELFSMESNQHGKHEENKIPGEKIPIKSISFSKENSVPVHYFLKGKNVKKPQNDKWIVKDPGMTSSPKNVNSSSGILHHSHDSSLSEADHYELRPEKKTLDKKNKDSVLMCSDYLDDLTQSSDIATEDYDLPPSNYKNITLLIEQLSVDCKDSVHCLKIQDAVLKYERSVELKKARFIELERKVKSLENKITGLLEELSETKKIKSQLEYQKVEWDRELYRLRFALKQEKEKHSSTEMLFEKIGEQLKRKEEEYSKEVDLKHLLEFKLRTLDQELRTVRNNFKQVEEERNNAQRQLSREQSARVLQDGILNNYLLKQKEIEAAASKKIQSSEGQENEKCLLHKNQTLQDEVVKLKLELETLKIKNQEKENRYTEENEVLKKNIDEVQKELTLKEEALQEKIFQYSGQVNVLTTEKAMLKSRMENEKQNREKLEKEIESYRSRLDSAILNHKLSQTSKLDLEHTFQRERDEWLRLKDKLKANNGVLSQELSKAGRKVNSLENELHQVHDSLREKTLVLESTQKQLNETQHRAKELEHTNEMDKEKLNKYIVKQQSIQEKLAKIQGENRLLLQHLEDTQNKDVVIEKVVNDVQVEFRDLFNKLLTDTEEQIHVVEERNKELINECNHLREQMHKYENEKTERESTIRKLQQELADSLKKQSVTEASLEATTGHRNDLEAKKKQLQKEVYHINSKLQESQERHTQSQRSINELEGHIEKFQIENATLEATVKQQLCKIEELQKNILYSTSLGTESEKFKKFIEMKQFLEKRLEQEVKRNYELQKDVNRFKQLLKTTKKKLREYEKGYVVFQEELNQTHSEVDKQINRLKHKA